jgi:hypothetical protein
MGWTLSCGSGKKLQQQVIRGQTEVMATGGGPLSCGSSKGLQQQHL